MCEVEHVTMCLKVLFFCIAGCLTASAFALDPNPPTLKSSGGAWPITRQWTPAETSHYAKWMERLFLSKQNAGPEQRMAKIEQLLTDPQMNLLLDPAFRGEGSNPTIPRSILRMAHSVLDCGKLTTFLPAYYAYCRGLPWMVTYVASGGGDVRTSKFNVPTGTTSNLESGSLNGFFQAVLTLSSGNYRVPPNGRNAQLSDSVPVALDPKYLKPGCAMYTDGHCLLLANVTEYGELQFINASTTNTRDIFTYNGMNVVNGITPKGSTDPADPWAGCFQGLRVFRYPIAETDSNGRVRKVRRRTDEEMAIFGYSREQYEMLAKIINQEDIAVGEFRPSNLHDYIRLKMRTAETISPMKFMEEHVAELTEMWKLREDFVQAAWADVQRNGPITYPEGESDSNIFQAHGRWETWSSPSSDVDRRGKYFYLVEWLHFVLGWYDMAPQLIDLQGLTQYPHENSAELLQALLTEKKRLFDSHSITYRNSAGQPVTLTLSDIEDRLYDLSFDPNHPPELRWGAPVGSDERATAKETYTPVSSGGRVPMEEAYRREAYYRTIGQRETEPSYLTNMFTEGFPVRDKLEPFLSFIWGNRTASGAGGANRDVVSSTTRPETPISTQRRRNNNSLIWSPGHQH